MIRSGLVNTRKGGGFEDGYPHQRAPRNKTTSTRPYVVTDGPIGERTDITQIVPNPVRYSDLFARTLTADERNYLFQKVKKGGRLMRQRKKEPGMVEEEQVKLPLPKIQVLPEKDVKLENEFYEKAEKYEKAEQSKSDMVGVEEFVPEDLYMVDAKENDLATALAAEDVVSPPIHNETFAEVEYAEENWIKKKEPLVERHGAHDKDDIYMETENNFGGTNWEKGFAKQPTTSSEVYAEIKVNGSGPRKPTGNIKRNIFIAKDVEKNKIKMVEKKLLVKEKGLMARGEKLSTRQAAYLNKAREDLKNLKK